MTNTADEYQQLAKRYAAMYDEELLQLGAEIDDLTDVAKSALGDELKHRKLSIPSPADEEPMRERLAEDPNYLQEISQIARFNYMWGGPSRAFDTSEDTIMASMALDDAGISNWIYNPGGNKFDVKNTLLRFLPQDEGRVDTVLAQPISSEIRDRYAETQTIEDFRVPDCPVCGTPDPLLESAEPVNEWFCESCGHQWKDA